MGVPKFYRWLSERYPQINQIISSDTLLPEIDNFYLDVNGIIHACTHPHEDALSNKLTIKEMMLGIFRYIDRIVSVIVKPKKLLFIAVDGVAPRAKLNQQRARRFRAGQERLESMIKAKQRGEVIDEEGLFDSNCITPGTDFMEIVDKHIRWFIHKKMKEDPIWRDIEVIYSGHDIPGEGEHKVMQFIRDERAQPNYPPNVRHCLYGQDADLIMLGLATHEPYFVLLREVIQFHKPTARGVREAVLKQTREAKFQLLHLSILREYIQLEFCKDAYMFDRERLVDDFIFLTYLVGNDFLPHLPTLDIGEHGFDVIFDAYRTVLMQDRDYLVENGEIKSFARLEQLFQLIGKQEASILENRDNETKQFNKRRRKYDKSLPSAEEEAYAEEILQRAYEEAIEEAKQSEWREVHRGSHGTASSASEPVITKDYRGRYYFEKFKLTLGSAASNQFLQQLTSSYLEGIMWCLSYYMKGCVSWVWYYPYHYGPMLIDMTNLQSKADNIRFHLGSPFRPFQQLLGCLPPTSKKLLPASYQHLMTHATSPLLQYYPLEFEVDMNGKRNPWEAVVLLPFIDEKILVEAEKSFCPEHKLSHAERQRNSFGNLLVYRYDPRVTTTVHSCNPEIGLADIPNCQTRVTLRAPDLHPGTPFSARLIPGTATHCLPGFPVLAGLIFDTIMHESVKLNIFGSESRYRTLILKLATRDFDPESIDITMLLGVSVYVNYPLTHEAKVVAVSLPDREYTLGANGEAVEKKYTLKEAENWRRDTNADEEKYLKGRGVPGTGGLRIGATKMRLRVLPVQGMYIDRITGARKKHYGKTEADIPFQMALWRPPVEDPRFQETEEVPVEVMFPVGSTVVVTSGANIGCKGVVVGPHTANTREKTTKKKHKRRQVDVEFCIPPPEPPFGYAIHASITDVYMSSAAACERLKLSPVVLNKIIGSVVIEPARVDIGLGLKKAGEYQLLGYIRQSEGEKSRSAWTQTDTVQIIGTSDMDIVDKKAVAQWEYSQEAIILIQDYMKHFPLLFQNLGKHAHAKSYRVTMLFGNDATGSARQLENCVSWLKSQPFYHLPRSPLTTDCMSRDAIRAIERAADVRTTATAPDKCEFRTIANVPLDRIIASTMITSIDLPINLNTKAPQLGDRVVNIAQSGIPFGLRGTVVAIHTSSGYVEVLFDEEFSIGTGLQGLCSQFRGYLVSWNKVLCVSTPPGQQKMSKPPVEAPIVTAEAPVVKKAKSKDSTLTEPSVRKVTSLLTRLSVEPEPEQQIEKVHHYHKLLEPRPPSPEIVEEPKAAHFVHTYETEVLVGGKPKKQKEHKHDTTHKHELKEKHLSKKTNDDPQQKEGLQVTTAPKSLGGFRILQRESLASEVKPQAETKPQDATPAAQTIAPAATTSVPPLSAKEKLAKAKMLLKALTEESTRAEAKPAITVTEEPPRPISVSPIEEIAVSPIAPVKSSKPKGFLVPASVIKKKKAI